jgi:DNA-binding response OmpR family regulator
VPGGPQPGEPTIARILIIDDDDDLRLILRKVLERHGYVVEEAPDGVEGVSAFRTRGADLVITDLIMPEKEGIETILELRDVDPSVPILAISGESVPDDPGGVLVDAALLGASATLAKPFELQVLLETIQGLLDGGGH